MAKKATTIVLIFVVVFLLASTVYVSIILTSDTGTTPKQSKASEIDTSLQQASNSAIPAELGSAPVNNGVTQTASAEASPNADPTTAPYANPSPTGTDAQVTGTTEPTTAPLGTETTTQPTTAETSKTGIDPTKAPAETLPTDEPDTSNLPETGLGQPTASPSSAMIVSPTMMATSSGVVATTQPMPAELPTAGTMTTTIAAIVVAGLTIFFAFIF